MPRDTCVRCKRPLNVCYCSALPELKNRVKVLIIQHPKEGSHPFNTGRMAALSLSNCELIVGDRFSDGRLLELLGESSVLLYPHLAWMDDPVKHHRDASCDGIEQLVVLDATWRKSKKILHEHPQLLLLPRISLEPKMTSNYTIRKSSLNGGLSTVESIALALESMESDSKYKKLLQPFDKMVKLQLEAEQASLRI